MPCNIKSQKPTERGLNQFVFINYFIDFML